MKRGGKGGGLVEREKERKGEREREREELKGTECRRGQGERWN